MSQWHDAYLVPKYKLRQPNINGKPVLGSDDLLTLLSFNIAYDTGIFSLERHRINLDRTSNHRSQTGRDCG